MSGLGAGYEGTSSQVFESPRFFQKERHNEQRNSSIDGAYQQRGGPLGAACAPRWRDGGVLPQRRVPASGQTTARQADINDGSEGNFVDVPDDGTVEAGATLRYQDNGDGTITDLNTKLTWEKKSDDGDLLHDKDNTYTWSGRSETIWDWVKDINTEGGTGFAGHDDWRIPNVKELQSLIDYERGGPAIDPVFNTNCEAVLCSREAVPASSTGHRRPPPCSLRSRGSWASTLAMWAPSKSSSASTCAPCGVAVGSRSSVAVGFHGGY